ncbi:MAG: hypothetical protein QM817_17225 [Archangium sp.]
MGDRSNLFFRSAKGGIGVYGHYAGVSMADAAMAVLKNPAFKARIGDKNYAFRIGVQTALDVLGATAAEETGYGLWTPATGADDNEHRYIVIDVDTGALFVAKDWKKVKPSEKIAKPTAASIRKKMTS